MSLIYAQYATTRDCSGYHEVCANGWKYQSSVSMSGGHDPKAPRRDGREELGLLIKKAFEDSDETYGYRRVWRSSWPARGIEGRRRSWSAP